MNPLRFSLNAVPGRGALLGLLGMAGWGLTALPAGAEAVDTELVLLVDITTPGLSNAEFDSLMNGYASAFATPEVMGAIQSGANGRIAVAMMFFGSSAVQQLVVPWMSIADASDASQFASLVTSLSRPFNFGFSDPAAGLTAATQSFGSETGAAANGFESAVQMIEVTATGIPGPFSAGATAAAGDAALAAGVDLINANAVGGFAAFFETYYEQNVIGSTLDGVDATSSSTATGSGLAGALTNQIATSTQAGADVSQGTAVPEPSAMLLLGSSLGLLLVRRRR